MAKNGAREMSFAMRAIEKGLDEFLLAMTVFLEARGEPPEGRYAVAHVIMNRAQEPARYGPSLGQVMLKRYQFSCFNALLCSDAFIKAYSDLRAFHDCLNVAINVLRGREDYPDNTGGANHYFADTIAPPDWADPAKMTVKIGHHTFYKL